MTSILELQALFSQNYSTILNFCWLITIQWSYLKISIIFLEMRTLPRKSRTYLLFWNLNKKENRLTIIRRDLFKKHGMEWPLMYSTSENVSLNINKCTFFILVWFNKKRLKGKEKIKEKPKSRINSKAMLLKANK